MTQSATPAIDREASVGRLNYLDGIVNLFALMHSQGKREAVSSLLSFRRPKLES